jgi:hypothetical protein
VKSTVIVPLMPDVVERLPIIPVHAGTHVLHCATKGLRNPRSAAIVDNEGTVTVAFVRRGARK